MNEGGKKNASVNPAGSYPGKLGRQSGLDVCDGCDLHRLGDIE